MRPISSLALSLSVIALAGGAYADDTQDCIKASESGQKSATDHHLSKAREQFLQCARDLCPAAIKKDCTEAMVDLDKKMPSIVVRAKDPKGGDLLTARLTIDGVVVTEALDGKSVPIDPGVHTFHLETAGQAPLDQKIVVAEGERDRAVVMTFGMAETSEPPKRGPPVGAFVVGGLGLVAIGIGGVFYGLGLSQRSNDLNGACGTVENGVNPQTSCSDERGSIQTKLVVGDILTGIGIAGVLTGVIWAVVHYTSARKEKVSAATAFDFRPLPGGGVTTAGFSF